LRRRQLSVRLSEREIKALISSASAVGSPEEAGPHELARIRIGDRLLVVYRTGKVVFHEGLRGLVRSVMERPSGASLGSDEAGKGELTGPIVVAAVALGPESTLDLRMAGLDDSKRLRGTRLRELASLIRRRAESFCVLSISPERIASIWSRGSLNRLLAGWHRRVLERAASSAGEVETICVDSFDRRALSEALSDLARSLRARLILSHGAEEVCPSVAAASVLARSERDLLVEAGITGGKWRSSRRP